MTVVETVPVCTNEIRQLAVGGGADAALSWDRRPCASSYDVIRGEITPGSAGGSIGIVTCIANDFLGGDVTHTFMAGPHDAEIPAEGHAFFYLVRANGEPFGGDTYGQGSDGAERLPVAGDCPP